MTIFWQIIFWFSAFLIIYNYLIFPVVLNFLTKNKKLSYDSYDKNEDLPEISIVMAVHNEEKIIEQKIRSVYNTDYPVSKIEFLIGSDNSTDQTNTIIKKLQKEYPSLYLYEFNDRNGKIKIINKLVKKAKNPVLVSTDAKAIFQPDTLFHLIKYFKDPQITIVGAILINQKENEKGIVKQEEIFMMREMKIKYNEGLIWGHSIGIYGALYAIRTQDFPQVPENLLVDDFYINMKIVTNGGKAIFSPEAVAIENLPDELKEEFKRKVRIATGNFQNMKKFIKYSIIPYNSISFAFISHKVIRWTTPFTFFVMLIALFFLKNLILYKIIIFVIIAFFLIPVVDYILKHFGVNNKIFRLVTHFISMNIALFLGFIKFLTGVKNSYWQPSNR